MAPVVDCEHPRPAAPAVTDGGAASPDALIGRIASARDTRAFAELFRAMAPRLAGYLRRLQLDDAMVEDVLQDVMLTVWRRAHQFDPQRASAGTWIFTIARNRRIDVLRKERRPALDPEDPALAGEAPVRPDEALDTSEARARVRAALRDLPDEQADLMRRAFFEGKSHSAIAAELEMPLGTVKSRLRLAAAKLRTSLEAHE